MVVDSSGVLSQAVGVTSNSDPATIALACVPASCLPEATDLAPITHGQHLADAYFSDSTCLQCMHAIAWLILVSSVWLAGVVLPLLQQSVMFFNIAFSRLVLRKKLAWQQYVGALAVVVGVCFAALPESGGTSIFAGVRRMSLRCLSKVEHIGHPPTEQGRSMAGRPMQARSQHCAHAARP